MEKLITDGMYLHINNGGVSIAVTNSDGLSLEIEAGHFGNVTNKMKLYVKRECLQKLGEMFIDAASQENQKEIEYLSLEYYGIDKETGKTKRFDGQENVSNPATSDVS
ncbi:MAG: hypothetical protein JWM44_3117 [Bacilli bacterium]|nr:hypothetical protein [Bacilli bacterium]